MEQKKQGKLLKITLLLVIAVIVVGAAAIGSLNLDDSISARVWRDGGCKSYWWHNDQSVQCLNSTFCGEFMTEGLKTFKTKSACIESLNNLIPDPKVITPCENKCGDGICQENVCHGPGCPCVETNASCPKDCSAKPSCVKENGVCGGIEGKICCSKNDNGMTLKCKMDGNYPDATGTCEAIVNAHSSGSLSR